MLYNCCTCNFCTNNKYDMNKHNSTNKHLKKVEEFKKKQLDESPFFCYYCGNKFLSIPDVFIHLSDCEKNILNQENDKKTIENKQLFDEYKQNVNKQIEKYKLIIEEQKKEIKRLRNKVEKQLNLNQKNLRDNL